MKKQMSTIGRLALVLVLANLVLASSARAQFLGYVGSQSVRIVALTGVSAPTTSSIVQDVGQASHALTYCISGGTATSVSIQLEASVDGSVFFAISNPGVALSGCNVVTAGGWFPALRVNLVTFTAGGGITLKATYTGVAAPGVSGGGAVLPVPTSISSSGPVNPVQCDKTAIPTAVAPSSVRQLIVPPANQGVSICGGIISFDANPAGGANGIILIAGTGVNCGTGTVTIWQIFSGSVNQPIPIAPGVGGSFVRLPPGVNLCVSTGAIVANIELTISYAQY